MIKIYEIC